MKKITLILLAVLLVAAAVLLPVIATTAGGVTASEAAGKPGQIITVTFSLHGFPQVQAIGAEFSVPEGLSLVEDEEQSKWLIDDPMLIDFSYETGMAAVGYAKAADFTAERDILQFAFLIEEPTDKPLAEEIDFNVHFVIKDNKNQKTELDAAAKISVSAPADAISLDKNALTLDLSGSKQEALNATVKPVYTTDEIQWNSDNNAVATVDENGKVTAVAPGTANITVTAGKVSASCAVTVTCTHANAAETPAVDATCEEEGNNTYYFCADCGKYLKADKVTPTTKEAETLAALGHEPVYYAELKATCVSTGNVAYWNCTTCKNNYADEACTQLLEIVLTEVNPDNHVGGTELKDAKAENCYEDGYTGDTYCLSCKGKTASGEVIPATGKHVAASAWLSDETYHWHACMTDGCSAEVDKATHQFQWIEDKAATEDETGLKHEECSCGYKRSENTVIDKLPHTHIGIKRYPAVAATCVAEGNLEYWTCASSKCAGKYFKDAKCEQEYTESVVLPVNADNHVGGTELKDAKAENCYENGFTGNTHCKSCGAVTVPGTVIPATGKHVAAAGWKNDGTYHWHTCTTAGCPAEVEKAEHAYKWQIDKAATEDETGLKHEECECGLKRSEDTVIPKLDHVHKNIQYHAAVAATCVKTGTVEYWTCASPKCDGKYYGDKDCQSQLDSIVAPINADNHVGGTELKDAKAENCYENGFTGNTHCKSCGAVTVPGSVIPATGKHVAGTKWETDGSYHWHACTTEGCNAVLDKAVHIYQWKIDKAATEDETGLKHEECSCGAKRSEDTVIPKLDHVHKNIQYHAAVAATCVKTGTVEYWTCASPKCAGKYYGDKDCQSQLDSIVVPVNADNHVGGTELKNQLAPTCGEAGYTGDTHCSDCDALLKQGTAIPATGNHNPGKDYISDGEQHWKVCTGCGAKVGTAAHELKWVVDSDPSEEAAGKKHQECDVCGYICSENTVIEKLEHEPVLVAGKESTCTEDGVIAHYFCDNCDRYYASVDGEIGEQINAEDTVLEATGHSHAESWTTDATGHWHACHCGDAADKAEHTGVVTGAVEATKNEAGYTGDTICSVCEYLIAEGVVIPSKQEAVLDSIQNAGSGASVQIAVPNDDGSVDATIPAKILESAKGKDVELVLDMGTYAWKISGNKILAAGQALDMTVSFDLDKIPSDVVENLAGDAFTQQLSFAHSGDFGFAADLEVALDKACASKTGTVYRYNAGGELVLVATAQISAEGKLTVSLDKAADYVIVVTDDGPAHTADALWTVTIVAAVAVVSIAAQIVLIPKRKKIR